MKKNIVAVALLLSSLIACGQKKIDTVTLSSGKTIIIYDNKTWAYTNSPQKPVITEATGTTKTSSNNPQGTNSNYNGKGSSSKASYSLVCGARTKKGGACQRKVSGGGRCWQH